MNWFSKKRMGTSFHNMSQKRLIVLKKIYFLGFKDQVSEWTRIENFQILGFFETNRSRGWAIWDRSIWLVQWNGQNWVLRSWQEARSFTKSNANISTPAICKFCRWAAQIQAIRQIYKSDSKLHRDCFDSRTWWLQRDSWSSIKFKQNDDLCWGFQQNASANQP